MDEDADRTYFALDERVCLAPCAPFLMLPMFESAARFPAGANPWLRKPIHSFARRVERASVSPLSFSRARIRIHQSKTNDVPSFIPPGTLRPRVAFSFIVLRIRFRFPLRRISRDTHTHTSVSLHPIPSHRNGVPLCDTSIHPSIHSFVVTHTHTHEHPSIHPSTPTKQTRTALVVVFSVRRSTRVALPSGMKLQSMRVKRTNERTTFRASVRTPFGIRSDIWYTGCVWVFSI